MGVETPSWQRALDEYDVKVFVFFKDLLMPISQHLFRYIVLREKLLGEMLKTSIGNGMWQTLSEHEQHQKLLQLKMKEEKLRREGKLETMAIHLPGIFIVFKEPEEMVCLNH